MKFVALALGLAAIGVAGYVIDAQSRVPYEPAKAPAESPRVFATGRVEGLTPEIELRVELAGRIDEVRCQEGQWVEKGAVLLGVDDAQYRCEVALATAELDLAKAQIDRLKAGSHREERQEAAALYREKTAELEKAQSMWRRVHGLLETKAVATQEADNWRSTVDALTAAAEALKARMALTEAPPRDVEIRIDQAHVQAAKAHVDQANVQWKRAKLLAPIRGQILKVDARVGEIAGPNSPHPAVIMADTTRFRLRAFLEESDAPRVEVGMPAHAVADGLPDHEFPGRVGRISPRMERKELWSDQPTERYDTKSREIWIDLEGGKELVVGLRMDATIDITGVKKQGAGSAEQGAKN
jgi:multidrug resistance efflux pump